MAADDREEPGEELARQAKAPRRVSTELAPEQPDEGDGPDTGALREPLLAALNLLGEAQREVVLLHDLEGWTHGEIAGALGISEVMSRQHLFVARKKLRAELEGGLSEERKHG